MAPQQWAVGEQRQRLEDFLPTYLGYGERGNYQECWPQLFIPWFATWPASPIPLPNLDIPAVAPAPLALTNLTVKQAAAAKAKAKRDTDWRNELEKVRGMTAPQREVWCLAQGIDKKKQVCEPGP